MVKNSVDPPQEQNQKLVLDADCSYKPRSEKSGRHLIYTKRLRSRLHPHSYDEEGYFLYQK
jgi:hypothetical protein